ncbi:MAG: acyltransferase family protein [Methanomicrobiales archaeon]|nr:acyltransferase family protein [Methanomicrobiales archaeon]
MSDAEPAGNAKKPRLLFIDNLRILVISLVIVSHCSITYGGPGSWYFLDPGNGPATPFILAVADTLNQSFFMGFFTLVSAYFILPSLLRKGRETFVHDRLVRLGIPLLFYIIVINPFLTVLLMSAGAPLPMPVATLLNPVTGPAFGPMWFVMFLLIATGAYLLWTAIRPPAPPGSVPHKPLPGFAAIAGFGLLLGIVTAAVRIFLPIGTTWFFNFQPPFFPQYIALFIVGIWAAENRWFDAIPDHLGKTCTLAALALIVIEPFFLHGVLSSPSGIGLITGGLHWQAVCYALWEQMACVMIISTLIWVFSKWFNNQGLVTGAMAADSYTVYVFHPVVLVSLSLLFAGVALPQLAKFAIVLPLAIALSFGLAHIIRSLPGVDRVL